MAKQLVHKGKTNEQWKNAFKIYEDEDGFVTVAQLRELLPKFGLVSSSAEVDKLIQDGDLLRFSNKAIEETYKVVMKVKGPEQVDYEGLIDWIAPK